MDTLITESKNLPTGRLFAVSLNILLLTLTGGCAAKYGNYNRDAEIYEAFNNSRVPLEHRYCYYHSGNHPIDVIGVEKKYDASSRLWRQEDVNWHLYTARINDPSGRQIGSMYTCIRTVGIKFTDDNKNSGHATYAVPLGSPLQETETVYGSTDSSTWPSISRLTSNY